MDPIDRRMMLGAAGLAGVAAMTKLASAGPLSPPPGPVGSTGQTLDDIYNRIARTDVGVAEPRIPVQSLPGSATALHVITEPGSYYLTGNIVGEAGKDGIQILAPDVTVDLCGFALLGAPGAMTALRSVNFGQTNNLTVKNGHASGWEGPAFDVRASRSSLLLELGVRQCGPALWGSDAAMIVRCVVRDNPGTAIQIQGDGGVVAGCAVREVGSGIVIDGGNGLVTDNTVLFANTAVWAPNGSAVVGNRISNSASGVQVSFRSVAERNVVSDCGKGIAVEPGDGAIVKNNSVSNCATNYSSTGAALLVGNVSYGGGSAFNLAAGASHGPIVNVAGVGDISSVPGANHPWANFIY